MSLGPPWTHPQPTSSTKRLSRGGGGGVVLLPFGATGLRWRSIAPHRPQGALQPTDTFASPPFPFSPPPPLSWQVPLSSPLSPPCVGARPPLQPCQGRLTASPGWGAVWGPSLGPFPPLVAGISFWPPPCPCFRAGSKGMVVPETPDGGGRRKPLPVGMGPRV